MMVYPCGAEVILKRVPELAEAILAGQIQGRVVIKI